MFIDWAEKLELLHHNPEPGISVKVLTSPAHVSWALETCGQGFTLPIEEEDSITKVILLYKIWALESKNRPQPINDNTQYFLQEILKHSSLLFEARSNIKDVEKHAQLCSTVLDIYASIGRILGNSMSIETWEIFLKLLISITDSILRQDVANENIKGLQKKLCPQLLKVLFELWLLSRTRNPSLWFALKQRVRGWTHHISLILTWRETCFALTRRSTSILYGPAEGTDSVIMKIQDSVQTIALEDEYVFYSWHRMLNIIGNPNESIHLPNNFLEFMKGVELLVNQYLRIGTGVPSLSGTGTINLASTTLPSIKTIPGSSSLDAINNNARYMPPNGNTILHIFGTWFFDAIHLDRTGFDEGTSLAIKTLANTITTKHKTDFLPIYSSSFYSCMQQALSKEGRVLITAIQSSSSLFTFELKGLRCLLPFYVSAIKRILAGKAKLNDQVSPSENVRKSCLQILSTILSLPYQFTKTSFSTSTTELPSSSLSSSGTTSSANVRYTGPSNYNELIPIFSDILLEALKLESHFQNIEYLLNLVYVWQLETISDSSNFTKQSIKLMTRKICNDSQWSPDVILRGLKMLSSMSILYNKISPGDIVASQLVSSLCKYISSVPLANYTPVQEQILSLSFKCISSWLMVPDQWLFRETPEMRLLLLSAVVIGVGLKYNDPQIEDSSSTKKKPRKKDEKVQEKSAPIASSTDGQIENQSVVKAAAKETLHVLLNHLGNFPPASGASSISSLAQEEEVLTDILLRTDDESLSVEKSKEFMRYYITDDRVIICVIDRPNFDNSNKVCIIVRNETGRYAWDTCLSYLPVQINNNTDPDGCSLPVQHTRVEIQENVEVSSTPHQASSEPISVQSISNVLSYLESIKTHNSSIKNVDEQVHKEFKLLQKTQFKLNYDVSIKAPKPADPYIGDCKFQQSRIFLSHLGFLSLENRDKLYPLQMNQSFFQSLKQLDQQAERICIRIGVIYAQQSQAEEEEWYGNEGGSLDYQEFIATLGWGVSLSKHKGYYGTLDVSGNTFGSVAPYWANYSTEILFQVCTLMPNNPTYPDHAHKRKQASNAFCTVVWTEDLSNFNPQSVWKKIRHNCFFITVTPLDCKLYYVRLFTKNNEINAQLAPIVDGMIVSKKILSQLVRDTAIMAYEIDNPNAKTPHQSRQDNIEKIYRDCKRTCNLEQFYTLQFTELPSDQIGPSFSLPKARKRSEKVKRTESSKDTKTQQTSWVGPRSAARGNSVVGNSHRQKAVATEANEHSESPEVQKYHDSKEKKSRKKEKSKKKERERSDRTDRPDRPRSRIKDITPGEKKEESESDTQE